MTNKEFVSKYGGQAKAAANGSGIFLETILGQAILESSSGKSTLSSKYNNYFGIKANSAWKGRSVNMKTREVFNGNSVNINSNFRVYDSFFDSAKDYINFLKVNPRYTKAGVFKARTYVQQIQAIKDAGYATGLNYVSAVVGIVKGIQKDIYSIVAEHPKKIGVGILLLGVGIYVALKNQ
jgi:flagellum-specific peptidoglycan hydrolase FlgJ